MAIKSHRQTKLRDQCVLLRFYCENAKKSGGHRGNGRGARGTAHCGRGEPQIWLRLGSALLFIFRLKSAQKPNRKRSRRCRWSWRWRTSRSSCCLVWHVSVSNARVATRVAAALIYALNFSRVRLMRYLCAVTQRECQLVRPSTPAGQVHHFASYFLLEKLCQPSDLTTNTTGAAALAKGVDWLGLGVAALKTP